MNEDLKWLAENVHEWPVDGRDVALLGNKVLIFEYSSRLLDIDYPVTYKSAVNKAEWQAARDELSGKPSWDDAPEWAQWLAQDSYGDWEWFAENPIVDTGIWASSAVESFANSGQVLGDWRNTLERRPAAEPTEWRGPEDGLPPVGAECEYLNHITQTVDYCTVVAEHDGGVVVAVHEDDLTYSYHHCAATSQFRPLRTEEDKAVEEMVAIRKAHHWSDEQFCRELYRAGYRKQESN